MKLRRTTRSCSSQVVLRPTSDRTLMMKRHVCPQQQHVCCTACNLRLLSLQFPFILWCLPTSVGLNAEGKCNSLVFLLFIFSPDQCNEIFISYSFMSLLSAFYLLFPPSFFNTVRPAQFLVPLCHHTSLSTYKLEKLCCLVATSSMYLHCFGTSETDIYINTESVSKRQYFAIGSLLICNQGSIDQSHLSGLWFHAGKPFVLRAKEVERIGQDAISESIGYRLTTI